MRHKVIGIIAGIFFRLYSMTFRRRVHYLEPLPEGNLIYGFWHQDQIVSLGSKLQGKNITVISSKSRDGTIFATALNKIFGFHIVRGSSSRGGVGALVGAINNVKKGHSIVVTLDGPKGPRFKAKKGVIKISEKTQRPIVPARFFPRWFRTLGSWDRAKIPLPFTVVDIYFGKAKNYTLEELERALSDIDKIAEARKS